MNKTVQTLFLLLTSLALHAQPGFSYLQADWQQKVNYNITIKLDDAQHILNGQIRIVYHNQSPFKLSEFYMHLWPNAYSSIASDFARQKNEDNDSKFIFSPQEDRGYIDSLKFTFNGVELSYTNHLNWPDVVKFILNQPLESGDSLVISTPFRVKVPGSFSRLGHADQAYQISQWYPKPAVYDINGWHPMPYLDQGEFYSEFGKFNVKIIVPDNYVVAATGVLQEESEIAFLQNRINNPIDPTVAISSSPTYKTLTFIQDSIHDFAWFASKTFNIERSKTQLQSGRTISTYVYASEKKINYAKYIGNALKFYSDHAGEYPYSHCSVVLGSLKAGGGMEYPMITVCDMLNEEVIVHEVGHNWFYGILASNERAYPWMDESINTFFEGKTMEQKEENDEVSNPNLKSMLTNDGIMNSIALHAELRGTSQAPGLNSEIFTSTNYGTMVYGKGAELFNHLLGYLGEDVFYQCFREYYETWKFKHPLPGDMQDVFEKTSGKNLTWFFRDLMLIGKPMDMAIKNVKLQGNQLSFQIQNKGMVSAPVPVSLIQNNKILRTIWVDGHSESKNVNLELMDSETSFDQIRIDATDALFENKKDNNIYRRKALFHYMEPLKISLLSFGNNPTRNQIALFPVYGFNLYDQHMPGLLLHNLGYPGNRTEFLMMPMYGTQYKNLNGHARIIRYIPMQKGNIQRLETGIKIAAFDFENFNPYQYQKVQPFILAKLANPLYRGARKTDIMLRYVWVNYKAQFDVEAQETSFPGWTSPYQNPHHFVSLDMEGKKKTALRPWVWKASITQGWFDMTKKGSFMRTQAYWSQMFNYKHANKGLTAKVAGCFYPIQGSGSNGLFNTGFGTTAKNYDFMFDQSLMGRNARAGLFLNQVSSEYLSQKFTGSIGSTDQYAVAVGLHSTLPGKIPFGLYADIVTFDGLDQIMESRFIWQCGIQFHVMKEVLEIYIPLTQSSEVTDIQKLQGISEFHRRIVFKLNLNKLEPVSFMESVSLF